jgi:hypothetical protein
MTEYFNFEDGNGKVPAHKHPNGGGWVANTAYVADTAFVGHDARVFNYARVFDGAEVRNYARVYGYAQAFDYAEVRENAVVFGHARLHGYSEVFADARVSGLAVISGDARVCGIRRSDGYPFIYVPDDKGVMKVQAGCRDFTMEEAKIHWRVTRGGTPLGDETMEILKSLKRLSKVKPEGCV